MRRSRLWAIIGIVFVTMPQWSESVWSLFVVDKPMVPTIAGWIGVTKMPSLNVLGWVPTLVGLVLLVMVWEQTRGQAVHNQPPPLPIPREPLQRLVMQPARLPEQLKRADAEDERIFIDKSPVELTAPFQTFTDYKAQKLSEDYYNKWVRWTIKVSTINQIGGGMVAFAPIPIGQIQHMIVVVMFRESDTAKVVHLDKDSVIEIEGQIQKIASSEVTLVNGRFLSIKWLPAFL